MVAEIVFTFLYASLGIVPTVRHADNRAIVRGAGAASNTADFIRAFRPGAFESLAVPDEGLGGFAGSPIPRGQVIPVKAATQRTESSSQPSSSSMDIVRSRMSQTRGRYPKPTSSPAL